MATPAEDVASRIASAVPGYTLGTNLFIGKARAANLTGSVIIPMAAVFVEHEDSGDATPYQGSTQDDCEVAVKVTVRGEPGTLQATYAAAEAIRAALHRASLPGRYSCLSDDACPEYLEDDDFGCPEYEVAVLVQWTR